MVNQVELRQKFLANQCTIKNEKQDFHDWHQGRLRYVLWAVDVDFPAVRQQVASAGEHLGKFLLEGYCRQPHITLGISGFLNNQSQQADDYTASSFEADLAALKNAHLQPFELEIGPLASFSSAPFLYVSDPTNSLHKLHACLHSLTGDANFQYVPHVTVGLYSHAWPVQTVSNYLDNFQQKFVTSCLVGNISLMSYAASEIGGKLITIADYNLERAEIKWREAPLFDSGAGQAILKRDILSLPG